MAFQDKARVGFWSKNCKQQKGPREEKHLRGNGILEADWLNHDLAAQGCRWQFAFGGEEKDHQMPASLCRRGNLENIRWCAAAPPPPAAPAAPAAGSVPIVALFRLLRVAFGRQQNTSLDREAPVGTGLERLLLYQNAVM